MGDELSVDRIVHDMRMCRNFMVQTEIQYMFIYRAVLDALSELLSGESEKVMWIVWIICVFLAPSGAFTVACLHHVCERSSNLTFANLTSAVKTNVSPVPW